MPEAKDSTANELAEQRTMMAAERTFMAWARTSLSLISFGFSIYKLMEYAHEIEPKAAFSADRARNLGTVLVAMGVVFLIISGLQHWQLLKRMSPSVQTLRIRSWPLSLFLAFLLTALGILALGNMLFHIGPF
jgi:putative membrane protein